MKARNKQRRKGKKIQRKEEEESKKKSTVQLIKSYRLQATCTKNIYQLKPVIKFITSYLLHNAVASECNFITIDQGVLTYL
jgi:hypothetical protein